MIPERRLSGDKGLFATLAVALAVTVLLGAALFRSRKASSSVDPTAANANWPRDDVLMFDEPVQQIQK